MSRKAQLGWFIAACLFAGALIFGYMLSNNVSRRFSITIGDTTADVALLAFFAVKILWLVAAVLFIIQGFRVHWGWGLANIFLFPLAGIAFFRTHRREAMVPMIIWAAGLALLVIFLVCVSI